MIPIPTTPEAVLAEAGCLWLYAASDAPALLAYLRASGWDVVRGVVAEIAAERQRQIESEGWTPEHDDLHVRGEMAMAAAAYAYNAGQDDTGRAWNVGRHPTVWPWSPEWWKPKDRRRDLVKAAALIVAEIERLDRAVPAPEFTQ